MTDIPVVPEAGLGPIQERFFMVVQQVFRTRRPIYRSVYVGQECGHKHLHAGVAVRCAEIRENEAANRG